MCFEYREVSLLFRLCAVGPQRPFTVKSNWVKEDCPFLSFTEEPINQGIHRLSHLCLPARCSGPPRSTLSFYGTNVSINPTEWPPAAKPPQRSMGAMYPPSRPMWSSRCVGRGKRNLILAGFSLGPLL